MNPIRLAALASIAASGPLLAQQACLDIDMAILGPDLVRDIVSIADGPAAGIYVCGAKYAGLYAVTGPARWSGSEWLPVSDGVTSFGFDGDIYSMVEFQGKLVVSGSFIAEGTSTYRDAAVWDGTNWGPLGWTGSIDGSSIRHITDAGNTPIGEVFAIAEDGSGGITLRDSNGIQRIIDGAVAVFNGDTWDARKAARPGYYVSDALGISHGVIDGIESIYAIHRVIRDSDGVFATDVFRYTDLGWDPVYPTPFFIRAKIAKVLNDEFGGSVYLFGGPLIEDPGRRKNLIFARLHDSGFDSIIEVDQGGLTSEIIDCSNGTAPESIYILEGRYSGSNWTPTLTSLATGRDALARFNSGTHALVESNWELAPGVIAGSITSSVNRPLVVGEDSTTFGAARYGPSLCSVDFNGDCVLDTADITIFIQAFLTTGPMSDMNNDGFIDNGDINVFVEAFLAGC